MKRNFALAGIVLSALCFTLGCQKGAATKSTEKPIKFGFMVCNSPSETRGRFEPVMAYLSEKIGRKFELVLSNTHELEDLVKNKQVEYTHSNSVLYVTFHERYKAQYMVTDSRGKLGPKDTGAIITRSDSGIKTIADMKGKSLVFGPAMAPFGYLAQYYLMVSNGFNPEEDLGYYTIPWGSHKHEKLIYGVLYGKYDLGAAPRLDLDVMVEEGKLKPDDFHIVAESVPMPYCTVAALSHADPALTAKIQEALVNLTKDETVMVNGEVLNVTRRAEINGFVQLKDSDYDEMRKELKACNMDPYKTYGS